MRSFFTFLFLAACAVVQAEAPPIQQWIDEAIRAGGGVVTIPEGEHVLPKGLVIRDAKKLALRGMNKEKCVLKLAPDAPPGALLRITGTSDTVEVSGLTFDGGDDEKIRPTQLILADGKRTDGKASLRDVAIQDCLVQNFGESGILALNGQAVTVQRCSFRDGTGAAIHWEACESSTAQGNQIIRTGTAFILEECQKCLLEGNEARDGDAGIKISSAHPQPDTIRHVLRNNGFFAVHDVLVLDAHSPAPQMENNENLEPR